jgi:hypothetical protein
MGKKGSFKMSEADNFDGALSKVLSVSHDELKRREAEWNKRKAAKKKAKTKA